MRFPRMPTRRCMALVAVAGLMIGRVRLKQRRDHFLDRLKFHNLESDPSGAEEVRGDFKYVEVPEKKVLQSNEPIEIQRQFAEYMDQWWAYNAAMAEKYEYAARHPWLGVDPNPPMLEQ